MSSWGSSNYRPFAPFLYEVASHVKKTAIPAIIIISEGATSTLLGSDTGQYSMHLMVLRMPIQTQVDPALVDPVAMQLSKCKLENEPLYILSKGFHSRRQWLLVSEGYWPPFAQCVIPILCSGLKTLCRMDRTSLSITCTDKMCGLLHVIVKASFWISRMVQLNRCRQGFNNLCFPDTMVATNRVTSGNCMRCNQLGTMPECFATVAPISMDDRLRLVDSMISDTVRLYSAK